MELNENNKIIIYKTKNGQTKLKVKISDDTIWLTQTQIIDLFQSSKANVSEHISNIFKEYELDENSTVRKFRTVQKEGNRTISRDIVHYNLDMIISVGYRIKSLSATQFRIWATNVLKKHLVDGYTINKQRIKKVESKYLELQKTINLLASNIKNSNLVSDEAKGILQVIGKYSKLLIFLTDMIIKL